MTSDSTLYVVVPMVLASIHIWKFKGPRKLRHDSEERQQAKTGHIEEDELWRTCLKNMDRAWLLVYRVFSFVVILSVISTNVFLDGVGVFYFYTQWTFALETAYFGVYNCHSIYLSLN